MGKETDFLKGINPLDTHRGERIPSETRLRIDADKHFNREGNTHADLVRLKEEGNLEEIVGRWILWYYEQVYAKVRDAWRDELPRYEIDEGDLLSKGLEELMYFARTWNPERGQFCNYLMTPVGKWRKPLARARLDDWLMKLRNKESNLVHIDEGDRGEEWNHHGDDPSNWRSFDENFATGNRDDLNLYEAERGAEEVIDRQKLYKDAKLTGRQAAAVEMYLIEGLTYPAIGERMGIAPTNARKHVLAGQKKLSSYGG